MALRLALSFIFAKFECPFQYCTLKTSCAASIRCHFFHEFFLPISITLLARTVLV